MTHTDQEIGHDQTHNGGFRHAAAVAVALLALYFLGYEILCSMDYFDLARLPYAPHTDEWLYQIYRPLEWLRHHLSAVGAESL